MTRYFLGQDDKPKMWYEYVPDLWPVSRLPNLTIEPSQPTKTGLVNADGVPIMKGPDRIGYLK